MRVGRGKPDSSVKEAFVWVALAVGWLPAAQGEPSAWQVPLHAEWVLSLAFPILASLAVQFRKSKFIVGDCIDIYFESGGRFSRRHICICGLRHRYVLSERWV